LPIYAEWAREPHAENILIEPIKVPQAQMMHTQKMINVMVEEMLRYKMSMAKLELAKARMRDPSLPGARAMRERADKVKEMVRAAYASHAEKMAIRKAAEDSAQATSSEEGTPAKKKSKLANE
jgi:hypothetical protein